MMEIFASSFLDIDRAFRAVTERLDYVGRPEEDPLTEDDLKWFTATFLDVFDRTNTPQQLSCPVTARLVDGLFDEALEAKTSEINWKPGASFGALRRLVDNARNTWEAELKSYVFFGELQHAKFYRDPIGPWRQVVRFFECADDVEESRKCFALGRYTASVFHLMRVVEIGVLKLQMFLDGQPDPKAHLGGVIAKLETLTQKTQYDHLAPDLRARLPFLVEVLPQLHAVKKAWRNKVAHADAFATPQGEFTEEKALFVHDASLALMKTLGAGLYA